MKYSHVKKMMANSCNNCGAEITENFCGTCGQKKTRRIDRKYIIDELQDFTVYTNKGFFYSIKNIFRNPGKTAREFIEGKRINHYKPLMLAFVLSGFSAFIAYKVIGLSKIMESGMLKQQATQNFLKSYMHYVADYNSLISFVFIPVFAVFTIIAFRKWGQNYYEHVVMNAFFQSYYTILYIICIYPIMYLLKDNVGNFMMATNFSLLVTPILAIWFYKGFYPDKSLKSILLKVLAVFGMALFIYILFILVTTIAVIVMKPEIFKNLKH